MPLSPAFATRDAPLRARWVVKSFRNIPQNPFKNAAIAKAVYARFKAKYAARRPDRANVKR
jgi:hypothetical protein